MPAPKKKTAAPVKAEAPVPKGLTSKKPAKTTKQASTGDALTITATEDGITTGPKTKTAKAKPVKLAQPVVDPAVITLAQAQSWASAVFQTPPTPASLGWVVAIKRAQRRLLPKTLDLAKKAVFVGQQLGLDLATTTVAFAEVSDGLYQATLHPAGGKALVLTPEALDGTASLQTAGQSPEVHLDWRTLRQALKAKAKAVVA